MMSISFKWMFFTFVLGLILVPTSVSACQKNNDQVIKEAKKTIAKITAAISKLENSCDNGTCTAGCCNKKSNGCGHADCDGNCMATSCFAGGGGSFGTLSFFEAQNITADLSFLKKNFFHYFNSEYSFGFSKIWQPPKIS